MTILAAALPAIRKGEAIFLDACWESRIFGCATTQILFDETICLLTYLLVTSSVLMKNFINIGKYLRFRSHVYDFASLASLILFDTWLWLQPNPMISRKELLFMWYLDYVNTAADHFLSDTKLMRISLLSIRARSDPMHFCSAIRINFDPALKAN